MFYIILFTPIILSIIIFFLSKNRSFGILKLFTILYLILFFLELYLFRTGYSYNFGIFYLNFNLNNDTLKNISSLFLMLITILAFLISWYSLYYFKKEVKHKTIGLSRLKEYNIFINLFIFAMLFVVNTNNILVMWIALEATTIFTTFLISFYGVPESWEAAWKYIILCSVGLTLGLFGIILLIISGLNSLDYLNINFSNVNILLTKISFIFIVVGFGTKVGIFPMNSWLPDAHGKASTPVSALMSSILLPLALYIIYRLKVIVDFMLGNSIFTNNILLGFGLIALLSSGFMLIYQKHFKRALAYSSSENMGLLVIALGIGNILALKFGILHLIAHSFFKTSSFMSVGNILLEQKTGQFNKIGNIMKNQRLTSYLMIFSLIMLLGVPISPLFISEIGIIFTLFAKNPYLAMILVFSLILVFSGVLLNFSKLFTKKDDIKNKLVEEKFMFNSIFTPIITTMILGLISTVSLIYIF